MGEVVEGGEGMKSAQGHGLRLCHGLGVELGMSWSACMENEGNGVDGSPEGQWVMRLCQSM